MTQQLTAGDLFIPDCLVVDKNGDRLVGGSGFVVDIRRTSDNAYWDFGGTPQFRTSGWTLRQAPLAQVNATTAPGCYQYATGWSTTGLASGPTYIIEYSDTGGTAGNMPQRDDAQIVAAYSTIIAVQNTLNALPTAPSAAAISTQVNSDLTAAHGAGGYGTATGFATPTNVTNSTTTITGVIATAQADLTAIKGAGFTTGDDLHSIKAAAAAASAPSAAAVSAQVNADLTAAHGAGAYVTATGFATPANVTTSTTTLSSALTTAQGDLTAIKGTGFVAGTDDLHALHAAVGAIPTAAAPSAAAVSAQVNSDLTAAHGAGGYGTATGFATPSNVTTGTTAILAAQATAQADLTAIKGSGFATGDDLHTIHVAVTAIPTAAAPSAAAISSQVNSDMTAAHGAGGYGTATGFAVPGDVSASTTSITGAVTAAVVSIDAHVDAVVGALAPAPTTAQINAALVAAHGLALASDVVAVQGAGFVSSTDSLHAIRGQLGSGGGGYPTAVDISTQVLTDMATAHGSGSYVAPNLAAAITSINNNTNAGFASLTQYGDGHWATVTLTGVAAQSTLLTLAGVVATLPTVAAPTAGAVAAAVWATAEGGAPGSLGWAVKLMRQFSTYTASTRNRKYISGQNFIVTADDGVTVLATVPLASLNNTPITPGAGNPTSFG